MSTSKRSSGLTPSGQASKSIKTDDASSSSSTTSPVESDLDIVKRIFPIPNDKNFDFAHFMKYQYDSSLEAYEMGLSFHTYVVVDLKMKGSFCNEWNDLYQGLRVLDSNSALSSIDSLVKLFHLQIKHSLRNEEKADILKNVVFKECCGASVGDGLFKRLLERLKNDASMALEQLLPDNLLTPSHIRKRWKEMKDRGKESLTVAQLKGQCMHLEHFMAGRGTAKNLEKHINSAKATQYS